MRKFWNRCAYIAILQFVLVSVALSNTLIVNEQGKVVAETDRYTALFEGGELTHFHNKLTQETYTQGESGESKASTRLIVRGRNLRTQNISPEIKRGPSPLECELIYHDTWSGVFDNEVTLPPVHRYRCRNRRSPDSAKRFLSNRGC